MEKTWMPTAAGILNIISGGILCAGGIGLAIFAAVLWPDIYSVLPGAAYPAFVVPGLVTSILFIMAMAILVPGIICILGGVYALQRKLWGLALAGAILGFLFSQTVLCTPAIIFLALSRKEFL